jgi:DNA-binding transcriptional MerR regulator
MSVSRDLDAGELTVDQLARQTGMTVRNIRAHQSRGLLPPPEVRGRTGFYGSDHIERLELIRELQQQGFNLESIRRLIEQTDGSDAEVLEFTRAVRTPFEEEAPRTVTLEDLVARYGENATPELLRRAVSLGFIELLDDDRIVERSPRLARVGEELIALGIGTDVALDVLESVKGRAEELAERYVNVFLEEVWKPFEAAGRPPERWPEIQEKLERLRPLASESVLPIFQRAMTEAVEKAFGRELGRLADAEA